MQIKDAHNSIRMEIPINEGSKRVFSLMGDDYVTIKIKVPEPIGFERGDYVDLDDFGRFEIVNLPKPSYDNDTESYDYEVKFEAPYKKWRNRIFRFYPASGGGEASWSLTDTLAHHLDLILANLAALGLRDEYDNADYSYTIHSDVSKESKFISYDNTSILDALSKLADEWETEYWIEGNVIHFGKCTNTSLPKITLDITDNVESMGNSASQSDYATRIFAFGSDRNIPKSYRKHLVFTNSVEGRNIYDIQRPLTADYFGQSVEQYGQPISNITIKVVNGNTETEISGCVFNQDSTEAVNKPLRLPAGYTLPMGAKYRIPQIENNVPSSYLTPDVSPLATVEGVVQKRLMLPVDTPYVDVEENLDADDIVEKVIVFDSIYPRLNLHVTDVQPIEKNYTDEEGVRKTKIYYRIKDTSFQFQKEWQIDGEELRIVFESGLLAGMDFEAHYNPEGLPPDDANSKWFELTVNDTYGRELPDSILHPSKDTDNAYLDDSLKGDKFVLYNWDSSKFTQTVLIEKAEQELLAETKKYIKEISVDPETYSCELNSDYAYSAGLDENSGEYHFTFRPGQQVLLKNKAFFKSGQRESRIMGYECLLDFPYDKPTLTIGDKPTYSRYGELKESLENLTVRLDGVQTQTGSSALPILRTGDITPATDNNVYSALRSDRTYLSKLKDDRSAGKISSDVGFDVGDFLAGVSGARIAKDKETGRTYGELDELYVRVRAYFESLTVIEREALAGEQQVTPGGGVKCTSVVAVDADGNLLSDINSQSAVAYRCFFLSEQDGEKRETFIKAGDQVIAQEWNAKEGTDNKVSNRRWWRLVTAVNQDALTDDVGNHYGYIEVSKSDCEVNSDIPEAGDDMVQFGNRTDATRQTAIVISTVSADAPSMKLFTGIGSGTTNAEHYSLNDHDIISYGYDRAKGRAYMRCYGDFYYGDKDGKTWIKYDAGSKELEIKAKISALSTIGNQTLEEYFQGLLPEDKPSYVEEALHQYSEINGGLFITSFISAGYTDADGLRHNLAGMNGIRKTDKSPFLWGGGSMVDRFYDADGTLRQTPLDADYAKALIRMDGSAYFAGGNVGFEGDGSGWFGDKSTGNVITFGNGSMTFGSGIKIDLGNGNDTTFKGIQDTLESVLNFMQGLGDVFVPEDAQGNRVAWNSSALARVKSVKGFYSDEWVSARGLNPNGGGAGSGGASSLAMLDDVILGSNLASGQALVYNGSAWVNQTIQQGLDESALAAYLSANQYAKIGDIPSLDGYALKSELVTSAERSLWNQTATNLSAILGSDASGVIDKWDEIVAFLDTYTEADTLANLLSNKANSVHAHTIAEVTGLQTALDDKLDASVFGDMFEKVRLDNGDWSIKAKYGLWTDQFLTARGLNGSAGGGGISQEDLDAMLGDYAKQSWVQSQGYLTSSALANYLPLSGGTLTGNLTIKTNDWAQQLTIFRNVNHGTPTIVFRNTDEVLGTIGMGASVDNIAPYSILFYDKNNNKYKVWHSGNLTKVSQLTNDSGYLTSITKAQVEGVLTGNISSHTHSQYLTSSSLSGYATTSALGSYLLKSGGTMTGVLHLLGNQYLDTANTGSLNLNNSDIYGVNSIKFSDLSDSAGEGLQWYRDATHIDSFWVKNGVMYFTPNRTWGGSATDNVVLHSGNISSYAITAHQSLANYVTLNGAQTISGAKTFGSNIHISHATSADMSNATTNPMIKFSENGIQAVGLVYTCYDAYRSSKGLKVMDVDGSDVVNVWLEVQGNAYASAFVKNGGTSSQFLKADGSVDSNTYALNSSLSNYLPLTGGTLTGKLTIKTSGHTNQLTIHRNDVASAATILYTNNDGELGGIGIGGSGSDVPNDTFYFKNNNSYRIWHSGNDGSGSGLDADLLDGVHNGGITAAYTHYNSIKCYRSFSKNDNSGYPTYLILADVTSTYNASASGSHYGFVGTIYHEMHSGYSLGEVVQIAAKVGYNNTSMQLSSSSENIQPCILQNGSNYYLALKLTGSGHDYYMHGFEINLPTSFSQINCTNYNGTLPSGYSVKHSGYGSGVWGNASSATKLATARTIWGQSFDGTGNVDGTMSINHPNYIAINLKRTVATGGCAIGCTRGDNTYLGSMGWDGDDTFNVYGRDGDNPLFTVSQGGKAGVGIANPTEKLHISNGNLLLQSTNVSADMSTTTANPKIIFSDSGGQRVGIVYTDYDIYRDGKGLAVMDVDGDDPIVWFEVKGTIIGTTGIYSDGYVSARGQNTSSDIRLKRNLNAFEIALHQIAHAPSVGFEWMEGTKDVGSIAQYWEKVNPLLTPKDPNGYLTLQYGKTALLSVISVAKRVESIEQRVVRLERENEELKRKIELLERR